jgi:pilin isopeptide linkage protein
VIRYTTDGTEPDADSPAYTGPIMLGTGDWTIRAVAMADGASDSEIANAVYHIGYIPCGGEIRVRKALSGRDWTEKDAFEFTVEKSGDAPVTEKGTVLVTGESENHTESFGNVTFTRPGTYSWTITETHQGETIRGVRYAEEGQTVTITVKDDGTGKLIADQGVELTQTVTFTNTFEPEPFGDATFILPSGVKTIEASAFEGDTLISVVDAGNCENIGAYAFSGCTGLTKIRLPINCTIGEHAFDGCTALYAIYGLAGGSTQDWAEDHDILFIGE